MQPYLINDAVDPVLSRLRLRVADVTGLLPGTQREGPWFRARASDHGMQPGWSVTIHAHIPTGAKSKPVPLTPEQLADLDKRMAAWEALGESAKHKTKRPEGPAAATHVYDPCNLAWTTRVVETVDALVALVDTIEAVMRYNNATACPLKPGDTVRHVVFEKGKVVELIDGGLAVAVEFAPTPGLGRKVMTWAFAGSKMVLVEP